MDYAAQLVEEKRGEHLSTEGVVAKLKDVLSAVLWFADRMSGKLTKNIHKKRWTHLDNSYLFWRIRQECAELAEALEQGTSEEIIDECADIANLAMMLADNQRKRCRHV